MLLVTVFDPSNLKILLIPSTAGGICKKLLFSSKEKVEEIPTVEVAVVVTIPTGLSLPFPLPLSISSCVILYFKNVCTTPSKCLS
jgi:hypothetical protein